MPSTVNPPPRAGSVGSGRRSSPASWAARSRCATARRQRGLGQVAQRRGDALQRPDAADIGDRGGQRDDPLGPAQRGGDAVAAGGRRRPPPARPCAVATTASGPDATSARRLAASRTARSARNGLLPPSARSSAATAGRAASRASARPSSAKRSTSRSAAPASCGRGQVGGRRNFVSVMCVQAGREAIFRVKRRSALRMAAAPAVHAGASHWWCWAASASAASAWRLSQGPVDLAWLSARLRGCGQRQWRPDAARNRHRRAGLGGFHHGRRSAARSAADRRHGDRPGGRASRINIPRAEVSLSFYELLLGRIVPRAVELDGAAAHPCAGGGWRDQPRSRQSGRGGDSGDRRRRRRTTPLADAAGGAGAAGRQRPGTQRACAVGPAPPGARP